MVAAGEEVVVGWVVGVGEEMGEVEEEEREVVAEGEKGEGGEGG